MELVLVRKLGWSCFDACIADISAKIADSDTFRACSVSVDLVCNLALFSEFSSISNLPGFCGKSRFDNFPVAVVRLPRSRGVVPVGYGVVPCSFATGVLYTLASVVFCALLVEPVDLCSS